MTPQQLQQALMGLKPEHQKKFNEERDTFFNSPFPHDLPENFDHYRFFCGCVTNEAQLGISAKTYGQLFFSKEIGSYNIGNIVSICSASERATFLDYASAFGKKEGVNMTAEWNYMRESFEQMTLQVNALINPAMEKIIKKLQALQHNGIIPAANFDTANYKGKNIPLGK